MKLHGQSTKLFLLIVLLLAALSVHAKPPTYHYYGSVVANAPSVTGNVLTVGAWGQLWTDLPAEAPDPLWRVRLKVDGVVVWDNGDPAIPKTGWPGLVFDYTNLTYTLSTGFHTIEWTGSTGLAGYLVIGWMPGFSYTLGVEVK